MVNFKKLIYKYYQANKQIGHTVLTNDKVSGNDEWTLHSERSTIESEDSSTPCEATIVQCKYKTRTETEVRRTTENNSAVVALKHKQQRAPYLAFVYYTSLTTLKSILLACQMLSRAYNRGKPHLHSLYLPMSLKLHLGQQQVHIINCYLCNQFYWCYLAAEKPPTAPRNLLQCEVACTSSGIGYSCRMQHNTSS